jgi:hypothetical protein
MNRNPQSFTTWSKLIHSANQRQCSMNNKETKCSYKLYKIQTFLWARQQNVWFENIWKILKRRHNCHGQGSQPKQKKIITFKSGWKCSCTKIMSLQHKKSRNNNSNQNGGNMHGCIVFYGRFPNSLEPDHPVQDSNPCSWATTRNNTTVLWEPAL